MHWLVWGFFLGVDLGWGLGGWDDTTQPGHEYSGSWHIILSGRFFLSKETHGLLWKYISGFLLFLGFTGTGLDTILDPGFQGLVISDNVRIISVSGRFWAHPRTPS